MSQGGKHNPTVLLVGHCGPDSYFLRRQVERALPEAEIEFVNDAAELNARLAGADLLLVNRVLDGGFDVESGVELIARIVRERNGGSPAAILISNHDDAQQAAAAAGAAPGFGKRDAGSDAAHAKMRAAVNAARPA